MGYNCRVGGGGGRRGWGDGGPDCVACFLLYFYHFENNFTLKTNKIGLKRGQQSWARVPAGPSRDACPRSFISSSRSRVLFQSFFLRTKIRVPAFSRSKFCNAFQFRVLRKKFVLPLMAGNPVSPSVYCICLRVGEQLITRTLCVYGRIRQAG